MNNLIKKLLLVPAVTLTIAGCGSATDDTVYTVKLHHGSADTTSKHKGAVRFAELVSEATDGKVVVTVYPSSQLGNDTEAAEYIQTGSIEAGLIPTAKLSGFYAPIQVLDLPFLFPNRDALYGTLDDNEFKSSIFTPMQEKGFYGLNFWESGFKQYTANKPITSPTDFNGLKFRVMESPMLIAQYKALGANAIPIDFAETYNALQQKVVEGQENPIVSIFSMKFYEVQTDMTISNHGYLGYALLFGKAFWDKLPAKYQTAIQKAADEAVKFEREDSIASEAGMIEKIAASGTKVSYMTPAQTEAFITAMKPVHEQFRGAIGSNLLDLTYRLVEKNK